MITILFLMLALFPSTFNYQECLDLYNSTAMCDILFPPINIQGINWSVPFP